jgi:hypothetical protein
MVWRLGVLANPLRAVPDAQSRALPSAHRSLEGDVVGIAVADDDRADLDPARDLFAFGEIFGEY